MLRRRKACASELNASLLERFTTSAAKFRRKQTALTRAVLLITNKRSTLCVLSLLFVAKCSHKLGELPAGVRGMDIVVRLFYLLVFFISSVTMLVGSSGLLWGTLVSQRSVLQHHSRPRNVACNLWIFNKKSTTQPANSRELRSRRLRLAGCEKGGVVNKRQLWLILFCAGRFWYFLSDKSTW